VVYRSVARLLRTPPRRTSHRPPPPAPCTPGQKPNAWAFCVHRVVTALVRCPAPLGQVRRLVLDSVSKPQHANDVQQGARRFLRWRTEQGTPSAPPSRPTAPSTSGATAASLTETRSTVTAASGGDSLSPRPFSPSRFFTAPARAPPRPHDLRSRLCRSGGGHSSNPAAARSRQHPSDYGAGVADTTKRPARR
jgi:hypothetical protein